MKHIFFSLCLMFYFACTQQTNQTQKPENQQNWTHYVRTAGHGLNKENIKFRDYVNVRRYTRAK